MSRNLSKKQLLEARKQARAIREKELEALQEKDAEAYEEQKN